MTIRNTAGRKLLQIGAFTALSTLAMQSVQAGPIDQYIINGENNIQDTSGEVVFRCTESASGTECLRRELGDTLDLPTEDGGFETFDVFAGMLDFGNVNGVSVAGDSGSQLTALFAVRYDELFIQKISVGGVPFPVPGGVSFSAAGEAAWDSIFGDTPMSGFDLDQGSNEDVLAALYQSTPDTLLSTMDDPGGNFTDSIAAAQEGTLAAVIGLLDGSDDFFHGSALLSGDCNELIVGGGDDCTDTTSIYNVQYAMTFFQYELAGDYVADAMETSNLAFADVGVTITADLIGNGDLTTPATQGVQGEDGGNPDGFHYGNNINGLYVAQLPEPATLGLLGISLIGFAGFARRRRMS